MAQKRITGVDIVSLASFTGIFYAIIGLIVGIFSLGFGTLLTNVMSREGESGLANFAPAMGVFGLIAFPVFFFVCGFMGGIIAALLINLVLKIIKGLKIELED